MRLEKPQLKQTATLRGWSGARVIEFLPPLMVQPHRISFYPDLDISLWQKMTFPDLWTMVTGSRQAHSFGVWAV